MATYTGIGSRKTPPDVIAKMEHIAWYLARLGYTLRSGGANGADSAFETGCDQAHGDKSIYLAQSVRECRSSCYRTARYDERDKYADAEVIAIRMHPGWFGYNTYTKEMHTRNVFQVLGTSLEEPTDFVVCWTPEGEPVGGTRTAILLARSLQIPVYNLFDKEDVKVFADLLRAV